MNSAPMKVQIHRDQIVSQVAAWLYATGTVPDNMDISNIQFSNLFGMSDIELCDLTVFTQKPKEAKIVLKNV